MSILNLIQALDTGNMKKVGQLLDSNTIDVSMRDGDDRVALHYAAEVADKETFQRILNLDPSLIDCQDHNGYTPFLIASMSGNVDALQVLAENGANINHCDKDKHFAVHWAVVCGQLDALTLLLNLNANVNAMDSQGAQPLHYATVGEDIPPETCEAILHVLLKNGANVNSTDFDGRTPLLWATCNGNIEAMIGLLQAGANLNVTDRNQLGLLHCATSQGHEDALNLLIEASEPAVLDSTDRNGDTPLFYAVSLGRIECAKILLGNGANPNYQDNRLKTPSHCAAAKGQLQMLKMLKHYGASFEIQNKRGDIPLHEAIQSGSKDIVEWLLSNQPTTVNAVNHSGRSGLHLAAASGNMEIVVLLCSKNAEVDALMLSNDKLLTPLDVAELKKHDVVAEYLRTRHNANRACDLSDENRLEWITYLEEQIDRAKKQNSRKTIIKVEYTQTNDASKPIQRRYSFEDVVQENEDPQTERPYTVPASRNKKEESNRHANYLNQSSVPKSTSTTDLYGQVNESVETSDEAVKDSSCAKENNDDSNTDTTQNKTTVQVEVVVEDQARIQDELVVEDEAKAQSPDNRTPPINNTDSTMETNKNCDVYLVLEKAVELETEDLQNVLKVSDNFNSREESSNEEKTTKDRAGSSKGLRSSSNMEDEVFQDENDTDSNHIHHKHKNRTTNSSRVSRSGKSSDENRRTINKKKDGSTTTSSKSRKSLEPGTSSAYDSSNHLGGDHIVVHTMSMQSSENRFFYDCSSPEGSAEENDDYKKTSPSKQSSRVSPSHRQTCIFDGIAEKRENNHQKLTGSRKLQAQEAVIFQELTNLKKAQIQYGKQTEGNVVRTLIKKFCKRYDIESSQFTCTTYNDWEKLLNEQLKLLYAKEKQRLLRVRTTSASRHAPRSGTRSKQSPATPISVHINEYVDICNKPEKRPKSCHDNLAE